MPQLRSFSAYTKNANAGVSLITRQCTLSNIDGNYLTGVAGQYFQIHDKATAPTNTNVPIRSFLLANAGPINLMSIFQILGPVSLTNGLAVAISTTEATLTLGVGSFDVFGEIEEYELPITGLTEASTTGSAGVGISAIDLVIWFTASGPKHLYELLITNNEGATVYPMLFATDAPTANAGQKPFWVGNAIANAASVRIHFGDMGISPIDASGHVAGHFVLSSAATSYTDTTLTASASTTLTVKFKVA